MKEFIDEIWKPYPLKADYDGYFEVKVSNYGRVKTYNSRFPEGRIVKGSTTEGYPIVRLKLFKDRSASVKKKIDDFNLKIKLVQQEIRDLKKITDMPEEIVESRILQLQETHSEIMAKRKAYTLKTDKKRTVYSHFLIHRAVAEVFLGEGKEEDMVIHKDFDKLNNRLSNLAWMNKKEVYERYTENPYYKNGTYKEQYQKEGRSPITSSKLTPTDVLYIKEKLSQGKTLKELAHKFGVSDMQIHRIKTGENWSSVKTVSELKEEKNKKWQAT